MLGLGLNLPRRAAFGRRLSPTAQIRNLLFSEGQQGVLYYPKPMVNGDQVLYTDSLGTTLVSANDDPAGLMLDLHEGLDLGPELVTNGTFDADASGWTGFRCTTSAVDGELVASATGNDPAVYQGFTTVPGRSYVIEFDATLFDWTGGVLSYTARVVNTAPYSNEISRVTIDTTSLGSYRLQFVATNTTTFISFVVAAGSDGVDDFFGFDSVTARELPGNHATQPTAAAKMLYQTDGTLHWLAADGVDDRIKSTYESAVTQPCTLSVAIDKQDAGSDIVIVTGLGSADRHQLSINASGNLVAVAGGTTLDSGAGLANGKHIVTAVIDGASSSVRVDGVEVATGDLGTATAGGMTISSLWDGTFPITQDFYGGIHVEGIGSVSDIESYLNDLIGGGVL